MWRVNFQTMTEFKYYIPEELSEVASTESIIRILLDTFKRAHLLEDVERVQRYHNFIEMCVFEDVKESFVKLPVTWSSCSTYLVMDDEPIIVINIYGAKLKSRWSDLVTKFNQFGQVVNYYEVKDNYEGHTIRTGVRSIWLKNVKKKPSELAQGDRKLYIVYDKEIMERLFNIDRKMKDNYNMSKRQCHNDSEKKYDNSKVTINIHQPTQNDLEVNNPIHDVSSDIKDSLVNDTSIKMLYELDKIAFTASHSLDNSESKSLEGLRTQENISSTNFQDFELTTELVGNEKDLFDVHSLLAEQWERENCRREPSKENEWVARMIMNQRNMCSSEKKQRP